MCYYYLSYCGYEGETNYDIEALLLCYHYVLFLGSCQQFRLGDVGGGVAKIFSHVEMFRDGKDF